jgi:antitoxin component YwqK of YwqJK toxin-antitoxin module
MRNYCEGRTLNAVIFVFLTTALFIFLFSGCNSYEDTENILVKDGLIFKAGSDTPFTGRVLDTLDNRIIEYDVINGIKTGEFCLLSVEGVFAVHGFLEDNKNVGLWRYFYSDGKIESQGNFSNDRPHGKWKWFHESGKIRTLGYYVNGREEGSWKSYDENGVLTSVTIYRNGKVQTIMEPVEKIFI